MMDAICKNSISFSSFSSIIEDIVELLQYSFDLNIRTCRYFDL